MAIDRRQGGLFIIVEPIAMPTSTLKLAAGIVFSAVIIVGVVSHSVGVPNRPAPPAGPVVTHSGGMFDGIQFNSKPAQP